MKRTIAFISALATITLAAPTASAGTLTVNVEGISKTQGTIMLGVFDEATYGGDGAVDGAQLPVNSDSVTVTFEDLDAGDYAIRLYHDVNEDGELNTNPFGIPTEPYAFSNDAQGRFGPAAWEDAKFAVSGNDDTHTITMK